MRRRALLRLAGAGGLGGLAGCLGRLDARSTPTPTAAPVTTTSAEDVAVTRGEVVVGDDDDGPRVSYRLRNGGTADATVAVRTVLHVEAGGTYEATGYADVPAGGEVFLEYEVVPWSALATDEERAVRQGESHVEVYVNGEHRPDV